MHNTLVGGLTVVNFGCRLNIAEGAAIERAIEGRSSTTVINGCGVTNEAMHETARAARRARRASPGERVVVTGCAAQIEPERFAAMPEVDLVLGNSEKLRPDSYRVDGLQVGDIMAPALQSWPTVSGKGKTRVFVEVQNGCDHRCTFCIIPFGRGNSRSVPVAAVVDAITAEVAAGRQEVVLTGVDLTAFRPSLAELVVAILRGVPTLPRLRLSSLDPAEIDEALIELIAHEPRVMPHLHLSLQSGDALILKRMKRRHTPAQAVAVVDRLKAVRPDIAVGADLIAGFPTEGEAAHANTLTIIDRCDLAFAHVFPYSPRTGTPAARMPAVPAVIARDRAATLRAASAVRQAILFTTMIASEQDVLIESDGRTGHAPNFARVRLAAAVRPGAVVRTRIVATDGAHLLGEPA